MQLPNRNRVRSAVTSEFRRLAVAILFCVPFAGADPLLAQPEPIESRPVIMGEMARNPLARMADGRVLVVDVLTTRKEDGTGSGARFFDGRFERVDMEIPPDLACLRWEVRDLPEYQIRLGDTCHEDGAIWSSEPVSPLRQKPSRLVNPFWEDGEFLRRRPISHKSFAPPPEALRPALSPEEAANRGSKNHLWGELPKEPVESPWVVWQIPCFSKQVPKNPLAWQEMAMLQASMAGIPPIQPRKKFSSKDGRLVVTDLPVTDKWAETDSYAPIKNHLAKHFPRRELLLHGDPPLEAAEHDEERLRVQFLELGEGRFARLYGMGLDIFTVSPQGVPRLETHINLDSYYLHEGTHLFNSWPEIGSAISAMGRIEGSDDIVIVRRFQVKVGYPVRLFVVRRDSPRIEIFAGHYQGIPSDEQYFAVIRASYESSVEFTR